MIEQYELRRNETQITIRDPFTLCITFKNSKDYGEPNITYQLAGTAEQRPLGPMCDCFNGGNRV